MGSGQYNSLNNKERVVRDQTQNNLLNKEGHLCWLGSGPIQLVYLWRISGVEWDQAQYNSLNIKEYLVLNGIRPNTAC